MPDAAVTEAQEAHQKDTIADLVAALLSIDDSPAATELLIAEFEPSSAAHPTTASSLSASMDPQRHPPIADGSSVPSTEAKSPPEGKHAGPKVKSKDKERAVELRPLTLLRLPADILQTICKDFCNSNDLASMARTCSTLYAHAIPVLYSSFDIVWHGTAAEDPSIGFDALSYGLSTLCGGSSFARTVHRLRAYLRQGRANKDRPLNIDVKPSILDFPTNDYAKYTRKFSLGNGPVEDISKYNINCERGKMLGTLVALSVSKMRNLENLVWDMPTGILSDVFMALASLPDLYPDTGECKLSRVWVRWHKKTAILSGSSRASSRSSEPERELAEMVDGSDFIFDRGGEMSDMGIQVLPHSLLDPRRRIPYAQAAVPFPTFSVLPPVKNVTALDIDDISYLDELAILIERSHARLEVLRIGIAAYAYDDSFAQPWDGPTLKQVNRETYWPGESTIVDQRLGGVMGILVGRLYDLNQYRKSLRSKTNGGNDDGVLNTKLKLTVLELERVHLSMVAITSPLDWGTITSLTLLSCPQQNTLWRYLRKHFRPTKEPRTRSQLWMDGRALIFNYHLSLKTLHTDSVRKSLLQFISETLRPNSLETLFLQRHAKSQGPRVRIEDILNCAVKPHSRSLTKLLLNGDLRKDADDEDFDGTSRVWDLSRGMVRYILGGHMRQLQQLSVSVAYADWHMFLQMLPGLPHMTALHIQNISNHGMEHYNPKDCALQIADILTLRIEMLLSFIGLANHCFEVIEIIQGAYGSELHSRHSSTDDLSSVNGASSDGDDDHHGGHSSDSDDESDFNSGIVYGSAVDDIPNHDVVIAELVEQSLQAPRFNIRAILFCDDMVSIFKARHGKL